MFAKLFRAKLFRNAREMVLNLKRIAGVVVMGVLLCATPGMGGSLRVIQNDPGGVVREYLIEVNMATLRGDVIRIEGWCASACTLFLSVPNSCVTPQARLAFHAPAGGTRSQNDEVAHYIAAQLPGEVGRWYLRNAAHLTGGDHATLSGVQLVQMGAARYC